MNCLILAGGPSLPGILQGRVCRRPGWFTIGINLAGCMIGSWVDVCFFADSLFWWNHETAIRWSGARKITLDKNKPGVELIAGRAPGVETWEWTGKSGIETEPKKCRFNKSSGGAAVNVAYHLGAKRILLTGYDMHGDENGNRRNWYPEQYQQHSTKGYGNMIAPFEQIAADAKRLGVEIINATPGSAITYFPFENIEAFKCLS